MPAPTLRVMAIVLRDYATAVTQRVGWFARLGVDVSMCMFVMNVIDS